MPYTVAVVVVFTASFVLPSVVFCAVRAWKRRRGQEWPARWVM